MAPGMKTDILFIKPDFKDIAVIPPLGFGYMSAILRQKGIRVAIHDNTLLNYDDARLGNLISEVRPRIIGLYAATPMIHRAEGIARLAKSINSDILLVLGGPHPSCAVEETLRFSDVVVMGEGEETFPEITERFFGGTRDFHGICGCAFKDSRGTVTINPPCRSRILTICRSSFI